MLAIGQLQNKAKAFCNIVTAIINAALIQEHHDFDFETPTIAIYSKLSEITCFEAEHSKFYKPKFDDLSSSSKFQFFFF